MAVSGNCAGANRPFCMNNVALGSVGVGMRGEVCAWRGSNLMPLALQVVDVGVFRCKLLVTGLTLQA